MKTGIVIVSIGVVLAFALPAAAEITAVTNVNLVPMTGNKVVPGQTVLVSDGKILTIGPVATTPTPAGAFVIDGAGRYLMPGLADMHEHIDDTMFPYPFCNLFLANGVTTVRDLSQGPYTPPMVLHYRDEIEAGKRLGPRILTAYTIWGGEKDIAGLVRGQRPLGYDCVKVNSNFSPAGFDTVMRESKKLGWYTIGHIPDLVRLDGVLAGGMNELSHIEEIMIFELAPVDWSKVKDPESFGALLVEAIRTEGKRYMNASPEEIEAAYGDKVGSAVGKLKGRDITVTTTVYIHEDILNKLTDLEKIKAAPTAKYLSPMFLKDLAAGTDKHQQMVVKGEERAWVLLYTLQNMLLKELHKNDVSLVLGTDVGAPYLSLVPGFSVHDELRSLTRNGFSPYEAIELATRKAGEVAGRMTGTNDFGTIEVGKRADLILLEKNPLDDVENTQDPLGVMAAGRWLPRDTLQMLLTIKHNKAAATLDSLRAAYGRGGIDAAIDRYRWFTSHNLHNEYLYTPATLVTAGYDLLGAGAIEDALRVLRLNIEEYPADWNAYDSYAEACARAGRTAEAIEYYEKALAIDPGQESPRKMLRTLRQK